MRTSWTSSGARHGLSDRSDATAVPGFIASPALAASLQAVLVDLIELHLQSKQAHWNVVGHNFRDLHPQLDEIIDIARDGSDTIAERLHALHATAGGRSDTVAARRPATDGLMPVESQGRHVPAGQPTMNLPVIPNVLSNPIAVRAATGSMTRPTSPASAALRGGCIMTGKLNIVLVHGAFGDGSHWQHIIPGLYQAGIE